MDLAQDIIPLIVALVSAGGIIGGLIALMKLRPEAGQIVVTAAQGALTVQLGVIETLQQENARLNIRVIELQGELSNLHAEVRELRLQMLANYDVDHPDMRQPLIHQDFPHQEGG